MSGMEETTTQDHPLNSSFDNDNGSSSASSVVLNDAATPNSVHQPVQRHNVVSYSSRPLFVPQQASSSSSSTMQSQHQQQQQYRPLHHKQQSTTTEDNDDSTSMFKARNQVSLFNREASFMYNPRVLLVLIASVIPFLSLTGKYSLALLATGFKIVYVLDFLEQKNYSFWGFWITLALFWCTIYTSSISLLWISFFNIFVLFQGSTYILTIGIWGSLNFKYLRNQSPEVTLLAERFLFAVIPFTTLPLLMTLIIGINGIKNSPFYLGALMCFMIHMFFSPTKSSFKDESKVAALSGSAQQQRRYLSIIQRPEECKLYCALSLVLPSVLYIAVYHRVLSFSFEHFLNLAMLSAMPVTFFAANPKRYLWWWDKSAQIQSSDLLVRLVAAASSLSVVVAWLEYRVIFRRYPYLLAISAPYNYIIVTIGLYSLIGLALLVLAGITNKVTKVVSVIICAFAAACGSFAIGFPIWLSPIPAAAAYFGSAFFFSRSWEQFVAFGITSSVSLMLWLTKSFWFLDFEFQLSFLPIDWTLRMSHSTIVILAFFIVCLFVFPACVKNTSQPLVFWLTTTQALLLAFLEQLLYEQGEGFYSEFLVLMTSGVGALLALRLHNLGRLTMQATSILLAVYIAKVSILFSGSVRMAFISSFAAAISFTSMYLTALTESEMDLSLGWAYFISSGSALFVTRHHVLRFILQSFIDVRYYDITETHLIGAVLFAWGIALLPLSLKYMKDVKIVQRVNLMVSVIGAVWGLWQPSLETTVFEITPNAIFSGNLDWVTWLMLLSLILILANMLNVASLNRFIWFRAISMFAISITVAVCFCATYLRYCSLPALLAVCVASVCAGAVELTTQVSIKGSYIAAFVSYGIFLLLLPLAYLLVDINTQQTEAFLSAEDAVRSARIALLSLYTVVNILLSVSIRFRLAATPTIASSPGTEQLSDNFSSVTDIGMIGNVAAIVAYILAVALTTWLSPDNIYMVYLSIAAIFLLLNKDNQLFKEWNENHRYSLTLVVMQLSMLTFFILDTVSLFTDFHVVIVKNYAGGEDVKKEIPIHMLLIKAFFHIILFFLSMPSQFMNLKFMYTLKRPNLKFCLSVCLPLAILTCLFANGQQFSSLYFWGASGIAGSLLQAFVASQFVKLDTLASLLQ